MKIDDISALLEKYQQGTCSPEERRIIEEWYDSLYLDEGDKMPESEVEMSLAKIRGKLLDITEGQAGTGEEDETEDWDRTTEPVQETAGLRIIPLRKRRWIPAAAAAVLGMLIGAGWMYLSGRMGEAGRPVTGSYADNRITVRTNRGETRHIILPDGSGIQLNAGTEIAYPRRFSGNSRDIELIRGEAFFQIITNAARPFTVITGNTRTVVLGTSFNIRAYGEEEKIEVALLSGKVVVTPAPGGKPATLQPHELYSIDKHTGATASSHFDQDDEVAAWKEGAMRFRDARFRDIAFEVGNMYNIDLINRSDKQVWSYTGLFRNGSLQEAIETICQTENLSYKFTDSAIYIINK